MKKTIAILLAVVMLLGCLGVAAVNAAETDTPSLVFITNNGTTYTADTGATITYRVYVTAPEVVENGQFYISYPQSLLKVSGYSIPNTPGYMINYSENLVNEIKFNFSNTSGCDLTTEKVLIEVKFEVIGDGEGEISFCAEVLCNLQDQQIVNQATFREEIDGADVYVPETSSDSTSDTESTAPTDEQTQPTTEDQTQPTTESGEDSTTTPTEAPTTEPTTDATQATTFKPAKNLGAGADGAAAESAILTAKNDSDPKGSTFNLLQVKNTKLTNTSIKLSYKKPSGTKKFVIYAAKCGAKYKKVKTTTSKTFTYKSLKKGTYYKFLVVALNKKGKVVATSKTIHVATKGGTVCNPKKVTITNAKKAKSIKKGKTVKLKTKVTAESKKLKLKTHRKVKFESSNTKVATVTQKGKIKAKKAGTCYIYAYAQNGVMAKVKVKVK